MLLTQSSALAKRNAYVKVLFLSLFIEAAEAAPKNSVESPTRERPTTLIGDVDRFGWYVAPTVSYTTINANAGLLLGAKGGVILDHRLVLGAAGYTFARDAFGGNVGAAQTNLGYGGAYAEYILQPAALVHFSGGLLVGFGSANSNSILVVNPQANAILNVSENVHLGAEVGYRFTSSLAVNAPNTDWFSGLSVGLFVQFGHF